MSCRRAGWRAQAVPSGAELEQTGHAESTARLPSGGEGKRRIMDLPVQRFMTKAEQAYLYSRTVTEPSDT